MSKQVVKQVIIGIGAVLAACGMYVLGWFLGGGGMP